MMVIAFNVRSLQGKINLPAADGQEIDNFDLLLLRRMRSNNSAQTHNAALHLSVYQLQQNTQQQFLFPWQPQCSNMA